MDTKTKPTNFTSRTQAITAGSAVAGPDQPSYNPREHHEHPFPGRGVALLLQGGGALGAYQAGVYQALDEAGIEPGWVAGVSIGGINCALIAGNPRGQRLERLEEFWHTITSRDMITAWPDGDDPRRLRNFLSSFVSLTFGQPNYFKPYPLNPWLSPRGSKNATAYYDSSPLRETLKRLIDFDLLNTGSVRYSAGAVNVETGNFAYFDNSEQTITLDHIMATNALPQMLPMIRIGRHHYWDGELVSNTPLQYLLDNVGAEHRLIFQVDLFSAAGEIPRDLLDVLSRHKDILYSSRTRAVTDHYQQTQRLKREIREALDKVPEALLTDKLRRVRDELRDLPAINILQLIYKQKAYEGEAKSYEFSRLSMKEHWRTGYHDTVNTLAHKEWLEFPAGEARLTTYDIHNVQD